MLALERHLAEHALAMLVARQHLGVAASASGTLRSDLEGAIAPMLASVAPIVMRARFDRDGNFGDRNADEAVAVLVDSIHECLVRSDHVDDFFVDAMTLRRSAQRAVREVFLRYRRGELGPLPRTGETAPLVVDLAALGYRVAAAASILPPDELARTLKAAARRVGARLVGYDAAGHRASFAEAHGKASLLRLEESITIAFGALVDAGAIELPRVERVFELPASRRSRTGLDAALREACDHCERRTSCRASFVRLPLRRIRLSMTPLTGEAARHVEAHFDELVGLVEAAIDGLASGKTGNGTTGAAISETRRRSPDGTRGRARTRSPGADGRGERPRTAGSRR